MDSYSFSSLPLLLPLNLFYLLLMVGFPLSLSTPELYENCHEKEFQCANISAGYPFSGGDRRSECGQRGLQLLCDHKVPSFEIIEVPYRVLEIHYDSQILKIARRDLLDAYCNPHVANTTLDYKLFEMFNTSEAGLGYNYTNITLLYDCPSSIPSSSLIPCGTTLGSGSRYKNISVVEGHIGPGECTISITFPILRNYSEGGLITDVITSPEDFVQVLGTGFEVRWNEGNRQSCTRCKDTNGTCGFRFNNQTTCYCPFTFDDWEEAVECPIQSIGSNFKMKMKWKVAIGTGAAIPIFVVFSYLIFKIWKKNQRDNKKVRIFIEKYGSHAPKRYSYSDVKKMTGSFKDKLGQGGYGSVYKGKLPDGKLIAIKVLSKSKGNGEDFINEVDSTSQTSHVNIVKLVGFCYESSKRALIYDYMSNGSLDRFIYDRKQQSTITILEWKKLYQITLGIARGLEYLHQGCNTRILHFDIKPHNILLDEEFRPRISDFGLAKPCQRQESIVSMSAARGTLGYMAPEVYNRSFGAVSYKSDVYSFGMMVLEMAGRRRNIDVDISLTGEIYFPHWIYKQLQLGQDLKLHGVVTEDDEIMARKMIMVGLWCIQINPSDRPSMTKVVEMLDGSLEFLQIPPQPYLSSPSREQRISSPPPSTA